MNTEIEKTFQGKEEIPHQIGVISYPYYERRRKNKTTKTGGFLCH